MTPKPTEELITVLNKLIPELKIVPKTVYVSNCTPAEQAKIREFYSPTIILKVKTKGVLVDFEAK